MQALSKALTEDDLIYLRAQFMLMEPNKDGRVSLDNFRTVIHSFPLLCCLLSYVLDVYASLTRYFLCP